jgi:hypothetical protein
MIGPKSAMFVGITIVLGACTSVPQRPQTPDLSGAWILTTESPMGTQDSDMLVKQEGEQLTGTVASQLGSMDFRGTFTNGKDVAFGFALPSPGIKVQIDYQGTVEGDVMRGAAKFGDFGQGKFVAKRKAR